MTSWRRNLIISALLGVLVLVVQLVNGTALGLTLLSVAIAVVLSLFVLRISDRYGRR